MERRRLKSFKQVIREMAFATAAFKKEDELVKHLQHHGIMDKGGKAAGPSAKGTDFTLNAGGKKYNGEYKADMKAGMGQLELRHNGKKWGPSEKAKGSELDKHWRAAKTTVRGKKTDYGNHVNKQWGKPSKDYAQSLKKHKSVYSDWGDAKPMAAHYRDRKVHYAQVGNELFHTDKDHAKLGTQHLEKSGIETRFRSRVKGRGHDKKTGKMKFGHLTTMEARRQPNAPKSPASLYHPDTLNKIKSIKPTPITSQPTP